MDIKKYIEEKFRDLEFEPINHIYTLYGRRIMCVSDMVSTFANEFNTEAEALRYAEKYGLDVEDVKREWKAKSDNGIKIGNETHNYAYRYCDCYFNNRKAPQPSNGYEQAVANFWRRLLLSDFVPVASELKVYTANNCIAGTFDLLLKHVVRDEFVICDYKTNKDLFKCFNKYMLYPFSFLLDMPLNKYQIQLSLYQIPLEEIGLNIIDRWIVWLQPTGEYTIYKTPD